MLPIQAVIRKQIKRERVTRYGHQWKPLNAFASGFVLIVPSINATAQDIYRGNIYLKPQQMREKKADKSGIVSQLLRDSTEEKREGTFD